MTGWTVPATKIESPATAATLGSMNPAVRCTRIGSMERGLSQTDMDISTIDTGQAIALTSVPTRESRMPF